MVITLIPSTPFLSKPVKFRETQEFYITSNFQFNRLQSSSITVNWTILICSPTCSNELQLNQLLETTKNNLFIPARTLFKGLYEFKFTVTMNDSSAWTSSSSSVYIEIIKSNVIINFIAFNTILLIHDYQQDLVLDPGRFSIDLNAISFNSNVNNPVCNLSI